MKMKYTKIDVETYLNDYVIPPDSINKSRALCVMIQCTAVG